MGWVSFSEDVDDRRDANTYERPPERATRRREKPRRAHRTAWPPAGKGFGTRGRASGQRDRSDRSAVPAGVQQLQDEVRRQKELIAQLRAENRNLRSDLGTLEAGKLEYQTVIRQLKRQIEELRRAAHSVARRIPPQRHATPREAGQQGARR